MSNVQKMSEKDKCYAEALIELNKMSAFLVYKQIADDITTSLIKKILRSKVGEDSFSLDMAETIGHVRGIAFLFKNCDDLVALYNEEMKSEEQKTESK